MNCSMDGTGREIAGLSGNGAASPAVQRCAVHGVRQFDIAIACTVNDPFMDTSYCAAVLQSSCVD